MVSGTELQTPQYRTISEVPVVKKYQYLLVHVYPHNVKVLVSTYSRKNLWISLMYFKLFLLHVLWMIRASKGLDICEVSWFRLFHVDLQEGHLLFLCVALVYWLIYVDLLQGHLLLFCGGGEFYKGSSLWFIRGLNVSSFSSIFFHLIVHVPK